MDHPGASSLCEQDQPSIIQDVHAADCFWLVFSTHLKHISQRVQSSLVNLKDQTAWPPPRQASSEDEAGDTSGRTLEFSRSDRGPFERSVRVGNGPHSIGTGMYGSPMDAGTTPTDWQKLAVPWSVGVCSLVVGITSPRSPKSFVPSCLPIGDGPLNPWLGLR